MPLAIAVTATIQAKIAWFGLNFARAPVDDKNHQYDEFWNSDSVEQAF